VNAAGAVVSRQSFAPFGGRRGSDWSATTPPDLAAVASSSRRGFTFHEHLDNLGLIHMNGRVYDPVVGRFLSADPFVVSADSGQSLNRYAYVLNNPLSFTDPSGFVPGQDGGPGWGEFPCLECYNVPSTYPHVPLPPHPGPGWHDRPGPNLVAKFDGGALVCYSDNCFVTEDVDSFSARFWRGFNGDSSVILDAEPTLPNTLGRYAGGTLKVALAVAGLAMIAVDVIDTPVSPGPDAGVVGAGLIADTATQGAAARTIISSTRGVIKEIETTADRIFYRVFSESNNRGRWLTSTRPRSSSWAQEALSLPPNNKASFVQEVLVPAGTKLQRSRAAPIPEWARMRGGAEQFKLLDEIPVKSFGPGVPLP
jgi:RHS repeat-associated protein